MNPMPTESFSSASPKWADSEEQVRFQEELKKHYEIEGRDFLMDFHTIYGSVWYAHRHSCWQELANAFHEEWTGNKA